MVVIFLHTVIVENKPEICIDKSIMEQMSRV